MPRLLFAAIAATTVAEVPLALAGPPLPAHLVDNQLSYPLLTPTEFTSNASRDIADIRLIKQRLYTHYLNTANRNRPTGTAELAADLSEYITALTPQGSFPDLDYTTRAKIFFPPFPHLQRLAAMAAAYRTADHPLFNSPELKSAILRGLDFWCRANPQTDHHWFIEIGAPMQLLPVLFLMESELPAGQLHAALPLVRASYRDGAFRYGPNEATGANMMWVARMNLEASVLEENPFATAQAARRFQQEIKMTEREGIQPDFSFTQHGHQLYAAGYGSGFVADAVHVANYLADTRFAIEPRRLELLADYITHGQQWMMRSYHFISGPKGREISRKPGGKPPATSNAETLASLLPARTAELLTIGQRMRAATPPDQPALVGNRHFWRVDLMTHHRPGWMAAVRMASSRVVGTESGNTENFLGHHLADGVQEIMLTGQEYAGIYPLWNWRQLPGTTVAQTTTPLPEHTWGKDARGTTTFVGGVSDGTTGLAAFDFNRDAVSVQKSWGHFDRSILAIGTNLTSTSPAPVFTTLNQCFRRGPVLVSLAGQPFTSAQNGTTTLTGPARIWHDSVGYIIPAGSRAVLSLEQRTGSWYDINRTQPKAPISADIFTLVLDHGTQPQHASYHYHIVPAITPEGLITFQPPTILAATPAYHTMADPSTNTIYIAFFAAGKALVGQESITVDQPCLLIRHPTSLTVADPSAQLATLNIELQSPDRATIRHSIPLPTGSLAGSSIVLPLND